MDANSLRHVWQSYSVSVIVRNITSEMGPPSIPPPSISPLRFSFIYSLLFWKDVSAVFCSKLLMDSLKKNKWHHETILTILYFMLYLVSYDRFDSKVRALLFYITKDTKLILVPWYYYYKEFNKNLKKGMPHQNYWIVKCLKNISSWTDFKTIWYWPKYLQLIVKFQVYLTRVLEMF